MWAKAYINLVTVMTIGSITRICIFIDYSFTLLILADVSTLDNVRFYLVMIKSKYFHHYYLHIVFIVSTCYCKCESQYLVNIYPYAVYIQCFYIMLKWLNVCNAKMFSAMQQTIINVNTNNMT